MLLTENINIKWWYNTKQYYINKGYEFTKIGDVFSVKINDLPENSNIIVEVKCDYCGCVKSIRYSTYIHNFLLKNNNKYGCLHCSSKINNNLEFEYIKSLVESIGKGYVLVSKVYLRNDLPLEIKCNKNHIYLTTYNSIRQGCKCPICNKKRWIGENNPKYNPNLSDEERIDNRDTLENVVWRRAVFEKNDFTCQRCGTKGDSLQAHHLNGYNWCLEGRFDINNGITLCKKCHTDFHNKNGYGDNTIEQFQDYINRYKNKTKKLA